MFLTPPPGDYPPFDRRFFEADADFTVIGTGALGGKARGLAAMKQALADVFPDHTFEGVQVSIPRLTVIATDVFEQFMSQDDLYEIALSDAPDERILHAFLKAELPTLILGDLRALAASLHTPLAVRSSSLLEDALRHPFAGTYATKMIANHEADADTRFRKLVEAIKYVWASTFFRDARRYMRAIRHDPADERMAVIVQEVVGQRHNGRFYPTVSGVLRTHNFYATAPAEPEDGVVHLALGLGKTIVDGGVTWSYCPRFPLHHPPFGSLDEMLTNTQTRFWAVNMGRVPHDPLSESEYLVEGTLDDADYDDVLRFSASTYDGESDRLRPGTMQAGPRVLTFAPLIEYDEIPLNPLLDRLAEACRGMLGTDIEMEFAITLDPKRRAPAHFGFLQLRPTVVSTEAVTVTEAELHGPDVLLASDAVLGNGITDDVADIIYVKPDTFDARHTRAIAAALEPLNAALLRANRPYLLIGFGRWGSCDPWLGCPVTWPQISGARVIVEASRPDMHVDPSQGSHFFHNITAFGVLYFTVRHTGEYGIDWERLEALPADYDGPHLRHVRLPAPLDIRVDGRSRRGIVLLHTASPEHA